MTIDTAAAQEKRANNVVAHAHYESILSEIGDFGRWQKMVMALLWLPALYCGMAFMTYSFTFGTPSKYRYVSVGV